MHTTGWRLGCGSSRRTSLAFFSAAGVFTPDVSVLHTHTRKVKWPNKRRDATILRRERLYAIQRYGPDMGWEGRSSLLSLYVSPRWKKVTIRARVSIFGALAAY